MSSCMAFPHGFPIPESLMTPIFTRHHLTRSLSPHELTSLHPHALSSHVTPSLLKTVTYEINNKKSCFLLYAHS